MSFSHLESELAGIASRLESFERRAQIGNRISGSSEVTREELNELKSAVKTLMKQVSDHREFIATQGDQIIELESEMDGLIHAVTMMAAQYGLELMELKDRLK